MDRASAARFVALGAIWGSSFLFIKVALEGLAPAQVVLGRLLAGAIVLIAAVAVRHGTWPREPRMWANLALLAMVGNVLPFFLFAWGEQRVGSALAGVLNAATPLLTMLIGLALLPEERATLVRFVGLVAGFAGVVVILAPWEVGAGAGALSGKLACLGAATCYGVSFTYTRRFVTGRGYGSSELAASQILLASAMALVLVPVVAPDGPHLHGSVVAAVLALGAGGTGVAYLLYYRLIADVGATTASMVTYVVPVVAVVLGVVVRDEPLTWHMVVGAVVVIVAVALAEGRAAAPRTIPAVSSP
ncbi:MAG TPA: DMT family transporter [Acidimicrobiales bacterium]|nr:DMT family transporter [Acidimicrobiales bacterium]